jgi:hypothetical protein
MKKILLYGFLLAGLIVSVSRPRLSNKDQTQAWADYKEAVIQQERIDKAERDRIDAIVKERTDKFSAELKAKYPPYKPVWGPMPASYKSEYFQPMPETYCSHRSYNAPRDNYLDQNDNSGLYYQRTIIGPNAGNWSLQFINGPN